MSAYVIEAKPIAPLTLSVVFADGMKGHVYFKLSHLTGFFTALADSNFFDQVYIEGGAVTWPNGLDLAPDAMYQNIKESGGWVLS
jgi:Protein of unknown function (DUF2442)